MLKNAKFSLDHYLQEVHSNTITHNINPNPSASQSLIPWTHSMRTQLDQIACELDLAIYHTVNACLPQPSTIQSNPLLTPTHTKPQISNENTPIAPLPNSIYAHAPQTALHNPHLYTLITTLCLQRHHSPTSPPSGSQPHPPYHTPPPPPGPPTTP